MTLRGVKCLLKVIRGQTKIKNEIECKVEELYELIQYETPTRFIYDNRASLSVFCMTISPRGILYFMLMTFVYLVHASIVNFQLYIYIAAALLAGQRTCDLHVAGSSRGWAP